MRYFICLALISMVSPQVWGLPRGNQFTPARIFAEETDTNVIDTAVKSANKSSHRVEGIAKSEFAPLVRLIESVVLPKKIRRREAEEFIALCKKYRADAERVGLILKKRKMDKRDKKFILSQARVVVMAWANVVDEHRENLSVLIAIGSLNVAINPYQELGHTFLEITRNRLVKAEVLADKINAYWQSLKIF